ncbi:malto-oligosyltrehalose trehalohydrolase [soil metagenome]
MTFTVWVPDLTRVRILVDGAEHEMTPWRNSGWWVWDGEGTDYAYMLGDDDTPLPDPRSVWQPDGVHGPSRTYDHNVFPWSDHDWAGLELPRSTVYELHIGTFATVGDFDSAIDRLDHLVDLGIDFVEVLPINSFDGPYGWGYDGVVWGAVHEPYGGPDGFKRFVNACHARGLGVVLDVVYNHLGPSGAYLDRFGPYFAGQNDWGPGLNLDGPGSDQVRRYVLDNAMTWFEHFHVDALRLDAVHALADKRALSLLEELSAETERMAKALSRPLTLIAESDLNDPRMITPRVEHGLGMDAQWADDIHHALHVRLTGETSGYYADFAAPGALATTLRCAFFHANTWSSFRHRHHGRPVDPHTVPGHRFVAYLQNHDQIGNRATGDRMSATVSPGLLACGAAIVMCLPYTPMVFMGEEWAASTPWQFFASFPDAELANAVRTGRRREFGRHGWGELEVPDPMDPATFARSKLDWSELDEAPHARTLALYQHLIAIRKAHPELSDPNLDGFQVETAEDGSWLVLHRGNFRLACNFSSSTVAISLGAEPSRILLTSGHDQIDGAELDLPPESFALVELRS